MYKNTKQDLGIDDVMLGPLGPVSQIGRHHVNIEPHLCM